MRRRELVMGLVGMSLACGRERGSRAEREEPPDARELSSEPTPDPPDPLGELAEIPASLRPAFDRTAHRPPPKLPSTGEPPQSFAEFLAEHPPRPRPEARTLAILPIGEYPRGFVVEYERVHLVRSPAPALLERFCEAWFGLPARVLPAMTDEILETLPARERDGRRQLDAAAILAWLKPRLPSDCACVIALTLEDLHERGAAWVFGLASIHERVAVHSMLRYDPGFLDAGERPPDFERLILTRALRVLAHEVAHMFGLRHCVHFSCVMNPTAGLEDLDALPLHLCPVCLRKLWAVTDFALVDRWEALAELGAELELDEDAAWFAARLAALGLPRRRQG